MPYNKISIKQLKLPRVISEDIFIEESSSGYNFELNQEINKDLEITGSLIINGENFVGSSNDGVEDNNLVYLGGDNFFSGSYNSVTRGNNNKIVGSENFIFNGDNNEIIAANENSILAGSNIKVDGVSNCFAICNNDNSTKTIVKDNSCLIQSKNIEIYGGTVFSESVEVLGFLDAGEITANSEINAQKIESDYLNLFGNNMQINESSSFFSGVLFNKHDGSILQSRSIISNNASSGVKVDGFDVATRDWVLDKNYSTDPSGIILESVDSSGNFTMDSAYFLEFDSPLHVTGDIIYQGNTGSDSLFLHNSNIEPRDLNFISGFVYDDSSEAYQKIATENWVSGQNYQTEISFSGGLVSSGFNTEENFKISDYLLITGDINCDNTFSVLNGFSSEEKINVSGGCYFSGELNAKNLYISGGLYTESLSNIDSKISISGQTISGNNFNLNNGSFNVTGSEIINKELLLDDYYISGEENTTTTRGSSFFEKTNLQADSNINGIVNIENLNLMGRLNLEANSNTINNFSGDISSEVIYGGLAFSSNQVLLSDVKGQVNIEFLEESISSGINNYEKQNDIIDISVLLKNKKELEDVWSKSSSYSPYLQTFTNNDTGDLWWKSMNQGETGYEDYGFEKRVTEVSDGVYQYKQDRLEGWMEWLAVNEPIKDGSVYDYKTTPSQVTFSIRDSIEVNEESGLLFENVFVPAIETDESDYLISGFDAELRNKQEIQYRVSAPDSMPAEYNDIKEWGFSSYYPRFRIKTV